MISRVWFLRIRQAAFFMASVFWIICIFEYIDGNCQMSVGEWVVSIATIISMAVICRNSELKKAKWFKDEAGR